ncbi:MAG: hypothetical protein IPP74_04805 [Alphaproteobacteria bacterium]|nr:hypothetical protein [Alphaproteobacteria bacterium]
MTFPTAPTPASYLMSGYSWTGTAGKSADVSFSFADMAGDSMSAFTSEQKTSAIAAMQAWANVANITFTENNLHNGASANILYGKEDLPPYVLGETTRYSYGNNKLAFADVAIDIQETGFTPGGSGYLTMLHEVGHALGFDHPGNYGQGETPPFAPVAEDSTDLTVMSYYNGTYTHYNDINPTGPMLYDIAAMQFLYGANHNYHSGNDTYVMDGHKAAYALWDGNGVDSLDASSYLGDSVLDLREGKDNVNHLGQSAVWCAFGANIENATSGAGNDLINGNSLNNSLSGNAGNDTISGNEGNDTLSGGIGNDSLQGNAGNDSLLGGDGNDFLRGGKDNDFLQGNTGNDILYGDIGNDTVFGGQGNDMLHGGDGIDFLYGDKGGDTLFGEAGNDYFVFNNADGGHDYIQDFAGAGFALGDVIEISSQLVNSIDMIMHDISYNSTGADINLGNGNIITLIGVTHGLTNSDFMLI